MKTLHRDMIADMKRRAHKKGRVSEDATEYTITATDLKRMTALALTMDFPVEVDGRAIDLDRDRSVLISIPIPAQPEPESDDRPTSDTQEGPIEGSAMGHPTDGGNEGLPEAPVEPKCQAQDYLMWVGYSGYPTIESFVSEAQRLGVSKRISRLPKDLIPGESRILLAHDEGIKGDAVIFGYFVVESAETIVKARGERDPSLPSYVDEVTLSETYLEDQRGCGYRTEVGALYLVNYDSLSKDVPEETVLGGGLVHLDEYLDYNALVNEDAKRFRSFSKVDGDALLNSGVTKTPPRSRAERTIGIPVEELPKPRSEWTDREREELSGLVERHGVLYTAFKEFERQTNRTMRSVEYQWFKMVKEHKDMDLMKEEE